MIERGEIWRKSDENLVVLLALLHIRYNKTLYRTKTFLFFFHSECFRMSFRKQSWNILINTDPSTAVGNLNSLQRPVFHSFIQIPHMEFIHVHFSKWLHELTPTSSLPWCFATTQHTHIHTTRDVNEHSSIMCLSLSVARPLLFIVCMSIPVPVTNESSYCGQRGQSLNQQRRLWANECLCLCDRYESDTQRSSSTSVKGFKRSAKEFYCFQIEFSILKIKM